jgi:hypothetical protein
VTTDDRAQKLANYLMKIKQRADAELVLDLDAEVRALRARGTTSDDRYTTALDALDEVNVDELAEEMYGDLTVDMTPQEREVIEHTLTAIRAVVAEHGGIVLADADRTGDDQP